MVNLNAAIFIKKIEEIKGLRINLALGFQEKNVVSNENINWKIQFNFLCKETAKKQVCFAKNLKCVPKEASYFFKEAVEAQMEENSTLKEDSCFLAKETCNNLQWIFQLESEVKLLQMNKEESELEFSNLSKDTTLVLNISLCIEISENVQDLFVCDNFKDHKNKFEDKNKYFHILNLT